MKQYLLSIYQPHGPPPPSVDLERIMRDVRVLQDDMKRSGAWVFAGDELPVRLRTVLAVVYLIFKEGYAASSGQCLLREDLCREAIRLGRQLHELMPEDPEVTGLLALTRWRAFTACSEGNRHQPAPLVAYSLE